jgi:protein SCO1
MSSPFRAGARARSWPLGAATSTVLVVACVAVGVAGALMLHSPTPRESTRGVGVSPVGPALDGDAVWAAGARAAPGFALRDQWGRIVSLSGQRGHTVLLAFMDSHCKMLCTLEGPTIHQVLSRLGTASRRVSLLVVSVNPWEDTAASSRRAVAQWGFAGRARWLLGTPAQLRPIWRSYGIEVVWAAGDVNHSSAIYLIDRRGNERAGFNYPFPAGQVVRDLRALAARRSS